MSDPSAGRIFTLYYDIHESCDLGAQPAGEGAVLGTGVVYVRWYYPPRGEEYADVEALMAYATTRGMTIEWPKETPR